jgi:hypothetical protein
MMSKFLVTVMKHVTSEIEVEAESVEDAIQKAQELNPTMTVSLDPVGVEWEHGFAEVISRCEGCLKPILSHNGRATDDVEYYQDPEGCYLCLDCGGKKESQK